MTIPRLVLILFFALTLSACSSEKETKPEASDEGAESSQNVATPAVPINDENDKKAEPDEIAPAAKVSSDAGTNATTGANREVRGVGHAFHAAANSNGVGASYNAVVGTNSRLHGRRAHLVDRDRSGGSWNARANGGLAGRSLLVRRR